MSMINTYVINLDGSDERLNSLRNELSTHGIDFKQVSAVDGRKYDLASVPDYDADAAKRFMGRGLVGGEIGCYHSHLKAAQIFLESDASYALILEDDAKPLCNILELLAMALPEIDVQDPDWLLFNIGNNRMKISTTIAEYVVGDRRYECVAAHYFPMTTSAIVWSRKGAELFIARHSKIFAPVDNYFRYLLTREGHGYSFWPAPVTTTGADSVIASKAEKPRQSGSRSWLYGFRKQRRLLIEKLIAMKRKRDFG